jgi:threonine/homoserine/homoserine lactone efflux protein
VWLPLTVKWPAWPATAATLPLVVSSGAPSPQSIVTAKLPGTALGSAAANEATGPRKTAVATALGHATGNYVAAAFVAVGLGSLLQRSAQVFLAVKLAGALYLVWIGVQAIRHRNELASAFEDSTPAPKQGWLAFRDGVVVGLTNPKSYILFGAVLPQFVNRAAGHVPVQMLLLAILPCGIGAITDCIWGVAASGVRTWFANSPRRFALVGGTGGLAMIAVGVTVAITGRKD